MGLLHLQGLLVLVAFIAAMFLVSHLYYSKLLNLSEDDFPNNELMMEGVSNSFGIFLVSATSISNRAVVELDLLLYLPVKHVLFQA